MKDPEAGRGWYSPFQWSVRHFRPGDKSESHYFFTPAGAPLGFKTVVPEKDPMGSNLSQKQARKVAEEGAAAGPWNLTDLGDEGSAATFELVESSDSVQLGGRVDYTFVYERIHERVGSITNAEQQEVETESIQRAHLSSKEQGRYRLRLKVSGSKFVELQHFVKIPEEFTREYTAMRSANTAIAQVSFVGLAILYGLLALLDS